MKNYRYELDKSSRKHTCPACEHKTFVLYIDNLTGHPVHSSVGRCDRANNCAHHYPPKQYFADNHIGNLRSYTPPPKPRLQLQPSVIKPELLKKSLSNYEHNHFAQWLAGVVGNDSVSEAIGRYFVGTWGHGTVFWQIDLQGRIRTGKIITYDKDGHRRKDIIPPVQWMHTVSETPGFILRQCFFGEHLLSGNNKPVAITESEKTAVIASIYLPDMVWLSCGNCEGLNSKKYAVLTGRNVVLYPDAKMFNKWSDKAKQLRAICHKVSVSNLIETVSTEQERKAGLDLADFLIRFSPSEFAKIKSSEKSLSLY